MLRTVLDDFEEIENLFINHDYEMLYVKYCQVIESLLFVTSEDEFADFINENNHIELDSFLLELAAQRELCFGFSVNDEISSIVDYIKSESGFVFDNEADSILEILDMANKRDEHMKYIAFFDDRYSEGMYYVFHIKKNVDFEICEGATVKQLV